MVSSKSDLKYAWPSTVNVANFVTAKPSLKGDGKINNFKSWKEQMICLLESQDVLGFVDGEILPPYEQDYNYKMWRRTDRLVKGWILGSVGTDVLDSGLRDKETARDAWLEMDRIFNPQQNNDHEDSDNEGSKDYSRYVQLYQATLRGDWDTAKTFFHDINEISTTKISSDSETALHIAVMTGKANSDFVSKLVEMMPRDALALKDSQGKTALHNAAIVGNTTAASALVNKNPDLLHILSNRNRSPVLEAAANCHKETLEYLISEHERKAVYSPLQGQLGVELLNAIITSEYIDIAMDLAQKHPDLAILIRDYNTNSALTAVAQKTSLFPHTQTFSWYQKFIYDCIPVQKPKGEVSRTRDIENLSSNAAAHKNYSTSFHIISTVGQKVESVIWYAIQNLVPKVKELREMKARDQQALQLAEYLCDQIVSQLPENKASEIFEKAITTAAKNGTSEIVEMIIHKFPMIIFKADAETGKDVFLLAASYRFENIINLFNNMSDRKYMIFDYTDNEGNNLMHICGKLAPSKRLNLVAGAALQMQRELVWFKEMEKFVHPVQRELTNKANQTPQMIFTEQHEKLKGDGEMWMKETANACTISAALIATVMFTSAFTVPGGLESASGVPLFTGRGAFELFAVSDAISLFASLTSLLIFLSILTERYAEEDFLYVLPKRLSMGLLSLFVSIAFMLVAFSATLYLVLRRDITLFAVWLSVFACFPLASLVLLQFPLFVDVAYSVYGPGIFGKKGDTILY